MTATKTVLNGAELVDFTGTLKGVKTNSLKAFGPEFVSIVRSETRPAALVVIDWAVELQVDGPVLIRDHLNLTGTSPLLGPNHEYGERFPVVQGIYIDEHLPELPRVIAAGLKSGAKVQPDDAAVLKQLGVGACCYNAVPAMLIAAHARCRILALLVPFGKELPANVLQKIKELTGAA
jgi:hypothetical protein